MTDNFSTDAMLVMIGLCKLMTKHGIKPSLSKSQHARVTKNGLDNIRGTRQCTGKKSGRLGLKYSKLEPDKGPTALPTKLCEINFMIQLS